MKTLIAMALAATALSAAPALAQRYAQDRGGSPPSVALTPPMPEGEWTLERRESWMQERLDRARTDGSLTRHDISRAENTLHKIERLQAELIDHGHGRLSDDDRRELEGRLDTLRDTLRWAIREDAPPWRR
jgi:hypothetical protein